MKDWLAFRPMLAMVALLALLLVGYSLLVQAGANSLFVPSPQTTASQFIQALGAHRFVGAHNQLSQDLQTSISPTDLMVLQSAIEMQVNGIEDAHELLVYEQGQVATARIEIVLSTQQRVSLVFQMVKENGLWKVYSLEPLAELLKPPPKTFTILAERER